MNSIILKENLKQTVITTKSIINGKKPILLISHDATDGMWQFLDGDMLIEEHAQVICMDEIFSIDPDISCLIPHIPHGDLAYRAKIKSPWILQVNLDS